MESIGAVGVAEEADAPPASVDVPVERMIACIGAGGGAVELWPVVQPAGPSLISIGVRIVRIAPADWPSGGRIETCREGFRGALGAPGLPLPVASNTVASLVWVD